MSKAFFPSPSIYHSGWELRGWAGVALYNRWLALLSCNLVLALFEAVQVMRGVPDSTLPGWPPGTPEVSLVSAALPFAAAASAV